jgi:hypothetical protein
MRLVEIEGNTLRLKAQGPGGIEGAGAGEMQLWSMLSAMGPMKPEDAEAWMAGFIPKTREDE